MTHVRWPVRSCDITYRSSQYAANNACLRRFGSTSAWMAILDVDEFMVPAGPYTDLIGLVRDLGGAPPAQAASVASTALAALVAPAVQTVSAPPPDVLYFEVSYCAPCRNDSGYDGPRLEPVGGFLGQCQCAGKLYAWRPKAIVRPTKVLMHWVHYAVVGVDDEKPRILSLDQATQGRNVHLRHGFSFQDHKTSMCIPGQRAFQRNIEGHRWACNASKQVWCRLDDIQRRAHRFETWRRREVGWAGG